MGSRRSGSNRRDRGESKSLREGRGKKAAAESEPKKFLEPKQVVFYSVFVVVVIVILLLGWRNGGASDETAGRAEITEWSLIAVATEGSEDVLCGSHEPCSLETLWPARVAGLECRIDAKVWLGARDNPMIVTGARVTDTNVTATAGLVGWDGEGANYTTWGAAPDVAWDGGWWWRAFPERLTMSFPIPCDAWMFHAAITFEGRAWIGGAWSDTQTTSQLIHTDMEIRPKPMNPGNGTAEP